MSKKNQRHRAFLRKQESLRAQESIRREQVEIKDRAMCFLFPYPGRGTSIAMSGTRPNWWWRWWQWALLGWRWEEK